MATSKSDIKTKIAELRHEILSYKPGKAVPCDDELVVFPDQLVIGFINVHEFLPSEYTIVSALKRAIHGDVKAIKYAGRRETSTKGQGKYLTDSISVIERTYDLYALDWSITEVEKDVKDLAAKVGCFVVLLDPANPGYNKRVIRTIKEITGRYPIVGLRGFSEEQVELKRKRMREEGIVEVYEIPWARSDQFLSDTEQLQLLHLLHGCLRESDAVFPVNRLKQLYRNTSWLYERAKEEATEAKQKMTEEIRQHEQVEESLQQEMKKLQMKLEESSASRESLVDENARLKNEIEREKENREQAESAMAENDKMARISQEMYKQRESDLVEELIKTKERHIKEQEDKCKEREETARREVERIKKENEEKRGRMEQLERETRKLRTKIQLESEIRSAEKKKKAETSQLMKGFIPWIVQSARLTSSANNSKEAFYPSQWGDAESELPNDEFADILKQIADDLYDEAKIDSLGGQLGIIQGDIERAIRTNMRFLRITSQGTHFMLKQWRRGVSRKDERMELRRALEAAKLLDLADRYLPQDPQVEESTGSKHPKNMKKVEEQHQLSGGNGTSLGSHDTSEESPEHNLGNEQHSPRDMTTVGESEDATEVTGTDQHRKLENSHGQSGKDGPTLAQGSPRGRTEVEETTATMDHSCLDDTSYVNNEEDEGVSQQSEESSVHSTVDVQDTSEDMPSREKAGEETSSLDERQLEDITTMLDDLVSSLAFSDAFAEKLYVLFFAKVIIDIRQKSLQL